MAKVHGEEFGFRVLKVRGGSSFQELFRVIPKDSLPVTTGVATSPRVTRIGIVRLEGTPILHTIAVDHMDRQCHGWAYQVHITIRIQSQAEVIRRLQGRPGRGRKFGITL